MPRRTTIPTMRNRRPPGRPATKLILFILIFLMAIGGGLFLWSPWSRVGVIAIEGIQFISKETVMRQSQLAVGQLYWGVDADDVASWLLRLPTVDKAVVTKTFPGKVRIAITEHRVVAMELRTSSPKQDQIADSFHGVLANGVAVSREYVNNPTALPLLSGWEDVAMKQTLCRVLAQIQANFLYDISEIRPYFSPAYPDRVRIYTRSQHEVITRIAWLPEKLSRLDGYIYELRRRDRTSGTLVLMETNYWQPPPNFQIIP